MSSQVFFLLNIGAVILLVLIFVVGKKSIVKPSKLNLRKGFNPEEGLVVQSEETRASEKTLNVIFLWNGHNFDAHEVLGCPAGANLQMVEDYYNQAVSRKGSDKEFLDAAYSAIKAKS